MITQRVLRWEKLYPVCFEKAFLLLYKNDFENVSFQNEENTTAKCSGSTVKPIVTSARKRWRSSQEDLGQMSNDIVLKANSSKQY